MEVVKVVDRYLKSEGLLVTAPALLAVCFEENLTDHLLTLATHTEPEVDQPLL